jgi:hypothetical protein
VKRNPSLAVDRIVSSLGDVRARVRMICQEYQDFLALVDDEEEREYVRERLIALRADVDISLGEAIEGSFEEALARLLEEEVK